MTRALASLVVMTALTTAACGGSSAPTSPTGTPGLSTPSQTTHNADRDCSGCHGFTVSGTAYRADGSAERGATVRLTTARAGGGATVLALTADGSGNFYTGASVAYGGGLYTDAAASGGTARAMEASVTSGACNRCHTGSSRIVVD